MKTVKIILMLACTALMFASCKGDDENCYDIGSVEHAPTEVSA